MAATCSRSRSPFRMLETSWPLPRAVRSCVDEASWCRSWVFSCFISVFDALRLISYVQTDPRRSVHLMQGLLPSHWMIYQGQATCRKIASNALGRELSFYLCTPFLAIGARIGHIRRCLGAFCRDVAVLLHVQFLHSLLPVGQSNIWTV